MMSYRACAVTQTDILLLYFKRRRFLQHISVIGAGPKQKVFDATRRGLAKRLLVILPPKGVDNMIFTALGGRHKIAQIS